MPKFGSRQNKLASIIIGETKYKVKAEELRWEKQNRSKLKSAFDLSDFDHTLFFEDKKVKCNGFSQEH